MRAFSYNCEEKTASHFTKVKLRDKKKKKKTGKDKTFKTTEQYILKIYRKDDR